MRDAERKDLRDLAAAYVLGALDPDELRRFESELAMSDVLRHEVAEFQEVSALLALDLPETQPDEAGWRRIQQKISKQRETSLPPQRASRRPKNALFAWSATAVAASVAVIFAIRANDVGRQLNDAADALSVASARIEEQDALLNNMLGAGTEQFVLSSPEATDPGLRVFWNRDTNIMVLQAMQLDPLGADRVYQLWFIQDDGAVIPSETFTTGIDGRRVLSVPGPSQPTQLAQAAVSIEPVGGSQQPTGAIVLVGAVGL